MYPHLLMIEESTVMDSTSDDDSKQKAYWTYSATIMLINKYKAYYSLFADSLHKNTEVSWSREIFSTLKWNFIIYLSFLPSYRFGIKSLMNFDATVIVFVVVIIQASRHFWKMRMRKEFHQQVQTIKANAERSHGRKTLNGKIGTMMAIQRESLDTFSNYMSQMLDCFRKN